MSDGQKSYIQIAAEEAKKAALRGEVPVGAVLVDGVQDKILAKDGNRMREQSNPTAHAELLVIQKGCRKLNKIHLLGCDLYVTLLRRERPGWLRCVRRQWLLPGLGGFILVLTIIKEGVLNMVPEYSSNQPVIITQKFMEGLKRKCVVTCCVHSSSRKEKVFNRPY